MLPRYAMIRSVVLLLVCVYVLYVEEKLQQEHLKCLQTGLRTNEELSVTMTNTSFKVQAYNRLCDYNNEAMILAGNLSLCIRPSAAQPGSNSGHFSGEVLAVLMA